MNAEYERIVEFHGHSCPGVTMGYRMAKAAMKYLAESSAKDEELVAIVENDACGVDAVQCLTGCTFGKGNFIFKDYGKQAYTFYSRNTGKGVRVVLNEGNIPESVRKSKQEFIDWLLSADEQDVVILKEVVMKEPEPARIYRPIKCDFCGERAMETRIKQVNGKNACIPCAAQLEAGDHKE